MSNQFSWSFISFDICSGFKRSFTKKLVSLLLLTFCKCSYICSYSNNQITLRIMWRLKDTFFLSGWIWTRGFQRGSPSIDKRVEASLSGELLHFDDKNCVINIFLFFIPQCFCNRFTYSLYYTCVLNLGKNNFHHAIVKIKSNRAWVKSSVKVPKLIIFRNNNNP